MGGRGLETHDLLENAPQNIFSLFRAAVKRPKHLLQKCVGLKNCNVFLSGHIVIGVYTFVSSVSLHTLTGMYTCL